MFEGIKRVERVFVNVNVTSHDGVYGWVVRRYIYVQGCMYC